MKPYNQKKRWKNGTGPVLFGGRRQHKNHHPIDYTNRLVDIRGPYGNRIEVEVDKDVKNFNNIKKGDEVFVRYAEAVAISVRPTAKAE